jgi:hypothetical protein
MNDREMIYRLMYESLLEIRDAARESRDTRIFRLADLLHNVPLQLERVIEGKKTYDQVLQSVRARAKETGCEKWVEQSLADLKVKTAV